MALYVKAVLAGLKDWKKALPVLIFTIARIIYGWAWVEAGWHKLAWLSDGKLNSAGLITKMATNLAGPEVKRFDPLSINSAFAWIGNNIFAGAMPAVTDFLVVVFEILIGVLIILGLRVFWAALVATFLNLQFIAAGSFNNFGYLWTNLALMKFAKYAEYIGIDGYLRSKKGKELL
ncbi:MAG: DoxX family membrane protein [Ruminiclostridium sp.]|nr:DoxX family membrane protein [Ruminiclostridium sp.]